MIASIFLAVYGAMSLHLSKSWNPRERDKNIYIHLFFLANTAVYISNPAFLKDSYLSMPCINSIVAMYCYILATNHCKSINYEHYRKKQENNKKAEKRLVNEKKLKNIKCFSYIVHILIISSLMNINEPHNYIGLMMENSGIAHILIMFPYIFEDLILSKIIDDYDDISLGPFVLYSDSSEKQKYIFIGNFVRFCDKYILGYLIVDLKFSKVFDESINLNQLVIVSIACKTINLLSFLSYQQNVISKYKTSLINFFIYALVFFEISRFLSDFSIFYHLILYIIDFKIGHLMAYTLKLFLYIMPSYLKYLVTIGNFLIGY
jgi:hypothetical protein